MEDLKDKLPETAKKKSQRVLKSGKQVEISLVEGSFRRIAGVREEADFSGSFILRTVEIRREPGQSLGFYIREGDGWLRREGVFISRVNLGSMIEVNGLLHVGDEVLKVNNVDVSSLSLDDVVLVMTVVRRLVLTIKVLTSVSLTRTLSARIPRRKAAAIPSSTRALPSRPISMCYAERIASKESDDVLLGEEVESVKIENPYVEIGFGRPQISASLNLAQPGLSVGTTNFSNNTHSSSKQIEEIEMSHLQTQSRSEPTVVPVSPSPPLAASTPLLPHKLQSSAQVEVHVDVEPTTENPNKGKMKPASDDLLHLRPPGLGLLAAVTRKQDRKDSDLLDEKDDEDLPPPVPPTPPPQDDYEEEETSLSLQNEGRDISAVEESEEGGEKTVLEEPDKSKDDHTCSGILVVTVRSLNVDRQPEQSVPTIDRIEFQMLVDSVPRVNCLLDPASLGDIESRTFAADIVENQQISITLKCDHFCKSRQVTLFTPATEDSTRKFLLPFKLENFGRAKINLEYRPMQIAVPRMDRNGYLDGATFKDFVETNPSDSKLPLVVERCVSVIEKYGLQERNLYHLCSSEAARDEGFKISLSQTKSEQDIEEIVSRISVHAFTGVLKDFFRKLPEPFFTSRLSASLTEVANMKNATQLGDSVMKTIIDCLPEETLPTYELLLEHFRHVCNHSSENGMTIENLSRIFGPLLLTPSINSRDLNTSATAETYADDYKSQARVIEILINSKADELPPIYKV
jgi:hypothetical protein